MKVKNRWTVVQHSGFGYGGNATFMKSLEVREVNNMADVKAILKAGGLFFNSYTEATKYEEEEPYKDNDSIIPCVQGTFADVKVDGLAIYIPKR